MKIVPGLGAPETPSAAPAAPRAVAQPTAAPARATQDAALESAVLRSAQTALERLPEVDYQRVAELRDALARGELPFDAAKLAALIQAYHRSGG